MGLPHLMIASKVTLSITMSDCRLAMQRSRAQCQCWAGRMALKVIWLGGICTWQVHGHGTKKVTCCWYINFHEFPYSQPWSADICWQFPGPTPPISPLSDQKTEGNPAIFWVHWAFSMVSSNWTLVAHGMDFGMAKLRTSRRSSSCGMSHLGPSDMMIKFMEFVIENTSDIHLLQTSDLEEWRVSLKILEFSAVSNVAIQSVSVLVPVTTIEGTATTQHRRHWLQSWDLSHQFEQPPGAIQISSVEELWSRGQGLNRNV